MAKTPRPVKFYVHATLANQTEILALKDQGHEVYVLPDWIGDSDMILSPNAWRFDDRMLYLLDTILKVARRLRYEAKPKIARALASRARARKEATP